MGTNENLKMGDLFRKFAHRVSIAVSSPWAFTVAVILIVIWAVSGPIFGYSDTWQLIINTSTTVITFLMVFLIQNSQNRDAKAVHLKLDELIKALKGARTSLIDLEDLSDEELEQLQREFERLRQQSGQQSKKAGDQVRSEKKSKRA